MLVSLIGLSGMSASADLSNAKTNAATNISKPIVPVSSLKKASDLIGMDVKNPRGERLGMLQDLGINFGDGKITYGVFSSGGFLGIGDKYISLPLSAFQWADDSRFLVLQADPGFLNSANAIQKKSNGVAATQKGARKKSQPLQTVSIQGMTIRTGEEIREASGAERPEEKSPGSILKATHLLGLSVTDRKGDNLGEIRDFAVDFTGATVSYFIVGSGGILGVGEKWIAVSPAILSPSAAGHSLVMSVEKETFKLSKGFDRNNWPLGPDERLTSQRSIQNEPAGAENKSHVFQRGGGTVSASDQSETRPDILITRNIRRGVMASAELSFTAKNVQIITINGQVTLRGIVKNEAERQIIHSLAAELAGANKLDDQIQLGN